MEDEPKETPPKDVQPKDDYVGEGGKGEDDADVIDKPVTTDE